MEQPLCVGVTASATILTVLAIASKVIKHINSFDNHGHFKLQSNEHISASQCAELPNLVQQ